jgi:peptidyl-prolyl cis-trans isomerase C
MLTKQSSKESKMHRLSRLIISIICIAFIFSSMYAVKKATPTKAKAKPKTPEVVVTPPVVVVPPADILVDYTGGMITKKDLDARINKLPAQTQGRFKTIDGQTQILDMMIVEEVFYLKAKDMNLLTDPVITDKINSAKKQVLIQEYYKRNVTNKVNMTEADKQEFYKQNLKDFYIPPFVSILYIQTEDAAKANLALKELNKGVPFQTVSDKYSINTYAKGIEGKIKNIRLNGYIPGVGDDPELDEIIKNAPVDTLVYLGPIQSKTGWSIIKVIEKIDGKQRPYLECEAEVDQRLRPKKETELLNSLVDAQKKLYAVVVDSLTLSLIDLRDLTKNKDMEGVVVVKSKDSSLSMTIKDVLDKFNKMAAQEQVMYVKGGGALHLVNQELTRTLMYLDASKDKAYDDFLTNNDDFNQTKRYYVLQEAYKKLVTEQVSVSDKDSRDFYEAHKKEYTTPEARKIQALWFKDNKTAVKVQKQFAKAAKKDNQKQIAKLVKQYSIKPQQEIIDNLYNNGVVTGIGPDQNLSDLIWKTKVGTVSPVAKSVKEDILVFRVLEERPAFTKSFTEMEPRILGQVKRDKEKVKMDEVKDQLFAQYNLKKYPEKLIIKLSADELFELADNAARQRKFKDATIYYDQIIQFYPNGNDDYKAFFMKAFLISEEIGNKDQGLMLFKEFIKRYPTGELNDSALYMIDELEGKHPQIDDMIDQDND